MIKIQITDTEDPNTNIILEGEVVLCSALNETGNTQDVRSGVVGKGGHERIVSLVTSAAKAAAVVLGDCRGCRGQAAAQVAAALLIGGNARDEVDGRLETLRTPPVDPLAKTTQPEPETAEA